MKINKLTHKPKHPIILLQNAYSLQIYQSTPGKPDMDSKSKFSDERYKVFIEDIDDAVYELDIHGNFSYFNDSLCKILGYSREEIQSQNISKFLGKTQIRDARDTLNAVWVTRKGASDLVWEIIDKNGRVRIVELSANLILNEEGKKEGIRGVARDITEQVKTRKALQESELRYQKQYIASKRAEKLHRNLLDFIPYPMVVFSKDGNVIYLNPAFTETFGWTMDELRGKTIPFVPPDRRDELSKVYKKLLKEKFILRQESRRSTKDGRMLDVVMRAALFNNERGGPDGILVFLRDITAEKRLTRNNDTLLRLTTALPKYPDLEDLLDYISSEVKQLLNTKGAVVILLDESKRELFFKGAAYDDTSAQRVVKEMRFPADKGVSSRVMATGKPIIISRLSDDPDYYSEVADRLPYNTEDILIVPLRSTDRIIGVLCAMNKNEGEFDAADVEMLTLIAGGVALYIENVRFSAELKKAYQNVSSLNRAKDKAINHLSHELITPDSVLSSSLNILSNKLEKYRKGNIKQTIERAQRNLNRILEIQYQVEDIMQEKQDKAHDVLSLLLEQCKDQLEALVAEEVGETPVIDRIRNRIEEIYSSKEKKISEINLGERVKERLKILKPQMSHRKVDIITHLDSVPAVYLPEDVIQKVIDGLIRNAIENTPDEGKVEITLRKKGMGSELTVRDYGVGITDESQARIFEGFFSTQETMDYSSKRPFDFNAGGKGADLLRMKIFSEKYDFNIALASKRCRYIPKRSDSCPGRIKDCNFCKKKKDCYESGETTATVSFPQGQK